MRIGRPRFRSTILALVLVWSALVTAKLFAVPTTQESIHQLGAEDPSDRSAAEVQLQATGVAAIESLKVAVADPRPEVSERALRTLRRIQISNLPDQPAHALEIADQYLSQTEPQHRKTLLNSLLNMKPPVNSLLARLAVMESDEDARRQILYRLQTEYRSSVGRWLAIDDDPQGVLQLLNGASMMWGQGPAADYAAALNVCGLLKQQTQICRAEQANGDSDDAMRAARQLCYFYRLQNKPDLALQAARDSHEPSLVFLVLNDQGNWAAAAKEPDDRWHDAIITSSIRAGYQRLSGEPQKALQTMNSLVSLANPDSDDSFTPSKFFMLNDMPEHGMDLMVARHPATVFAMRVARGEISQALEIARKYAEQPTDKAALAARLVDLRIALGELPEPPLKETPRQSGEVSTTPWRTAVTDLAEKRYPEAAKEFEALWARDRSHYDRLFLQGYALKMAGDVQRGQTLMRTAEMIPLGDPDARWEFANQLDAAGLSAEADAQRQLGLHTGAEFDEIGFNNIYGTMMFGAMNHRQWPVAADAADRLCLINLSPNVVWRVAEQLLTTPATAHLLRAHCDMERGDLVAAMRELKAYQQYLPASPDMVLERIPALDDLGQHDEADGVFNGVYQKLKAICDRYPRSILYQNQLAWMCACCGRKLDDALARADAIVALKPNNWQTMDTLAEVHFRRGERQTAVDLERHAAGLSNDPYLARQLKRFETASIPSTTQPGVAPE